MNQISTKKTADAKRGHPSPPAAKGRTTPSAETNARKSALLADIDIMRATDLGEGYVLIEVKKSAQGKARHHIGNVNPATPLTAKLPKIPEADVKVLLKELLERGFHPVSPSRPVSDVPAQSRARAVPVPDNNQAFMDKLHEQSLATRARQLEDGLLLTSADFCSRRGITRQALSRAVKDGRVFWLDGPSGTQLYPHFFAKPKLERSAFEKVSRALGEIPGASKWQFFTTPKRSLGGISPLEALVKGTVEPVIAGAIAFGER